MTPEPTAIKTTATDKESPECDRGTIEVNGICQVIQQQQMIPEPTEPVCGRGTEVVNGYCQVIKNNDSVLEFFRNLFS